MKVEKEKRSFPKKVGGHFIKRIITGVIILVPAALTFIILKWVFQGMDGILSPYVSIMIKKHFPSFYLLVKSTIGVRPDGSIVGIGFFLMLILLYAVGLFSTNFLGKRAIILLNDLLLRVPGVNWLYRTIKQVVDTITGAQAKSFKKVVLVNLLGSGVRVIGFVSGHSYDKDGAKYVHVFVPTSPNPTSGYLELLRPDQIIDTKLTVEQAVKIILSGGVITPEVIE